MPSSVIADSSYDETRNELAVSFVSGKVYVYSLVPPAVAAAMAGAFSKGEYFNANIRDRYPYRQVRGNRPKAARPRPSLRDALKSSHED